MTRHWWVWIVYGAIFIIVGAGHIVWFGTTHDPAIVARFGATLISLGIVVTAQPFFRTGLLEAVNRQMPAGLPEAVKRQMPAGLPEAVNRQMPGQHLSGYSSIQLLKQQKEEHKVARPGVVHDVVAERVIGVGIILFGTLVHGYGDLPLRWMGYGAI
jgi:hypothetical protein